MPKIAPLALVAGLLVASTAAAQTAAPATPAAPATAAPAAGKLSTQSTVAELMGNEKAKAVLTKHVPHIVSSPQLSLAMEMQFAALQNFPEAALTPELIKAIDADLAKL